MSFQANVSLPPNPYNQVDNASCYDAYNECLRSENEAGADEKCLMYAPCLGYLILEAPNPNAQVIIAAEILQCMADHDLMARLAEFYINHLFCLCEFAII